LFWISEILYRFIDEKNRKKVKFVSRLAQKIEKGCPVVNEAIKSILLDEEDRDIDFIKGLFSLPNPPNITDKVSLRRYIRDCICKTIKRKGSEGVFKYVYFVRNSKDKDLLKLLFVELPTEDEKRRMGEKERQKVDLYKERPKKKKC